PRTLPGSHQPGVTRVQGEGPAAFPSHPWVVPRSTKPRMRLERRLFFQRDSALKTPPFCMVAEGHEGYNSYLRAAGGPEVQDSMLPSSRITWRPVNPAISCWSFLSGMPKC